METIRELAARWGRIKQAERERLWAAMSPERREELTTALDEERVAGLARKWGFLSQTQRDAEWAKLEDGQQAKLREMLERDTPPPPPAWVPPTTAPQGESFWTKPRSASSLGCLLVAGTVLVLWMAATAGDGSTSKAEKAPKGPRAPTDFDARYMCEQFITDTLKSPKSAEFSGRKETTVSRTQGFFQVRGWVDAQNAFGATLRNQYRCEVQHLEGTRWRLIDLELAP